MTGKGKPMADQPGRTPKTPEESESELREMKVDELRAEAKEAGVTGTSNMRKDELVGEVAQARSGSTDEAADVGAGPEGGRLRTGDQTSSSLKYSQEVTSPQEEPERAGRSLATTHHEVIKRWAEERGGQPATVEGTEHGDHLGVLRFDFGGESDNLRHVSWDEWFETFDARRLNFIYQEETSDGSQSNFFRLESPDREDG
jgi:hypothetical protein